MEIEPYIQSLEPVKVDAKVYDVLESFHSFKERSFAPIVNNFNEPLGIVREQTLRDFTYTMFGRDLLKRRRVLEFLTPCPVVSHTTQFEDLIQTATFQHHNEGFLVVRDGKYSGFLSTAILVQMYEEHRFQTQQQLLQAQKMESIGTLAGGIAHDFNNILASISGHVELIKIKLPLIETDPVYKYLFSIETLTVRAAGLTKQLLGFARGGKYQVKPMNVNEGIQRVVAIVQPTFDRSIVFETNLDPGLGIIEGDAGQIEQVLMNLFINARDAMPGGGVLSITTQNISASSEVAASSLANCSKGGIEITVRDTGTGIKPEILNRIFEPFYTTKERGKGTGMGLAMVYGIVRNHGGQIRVQSEVGKGSAFIIHLPRSVAGQSFSETTPAKSPGSRRLEKEASVMVVDDDANLLPVISMYLEQMGCKVAAFSEGSPAITHYREQHAAINLVLLDMIMPGMSGQQVFEQLKQVNEGIKVIFISGYNNNGTMQELLTHADTDFLQKPFSFNQLLNTMNKFLCPV